MSAIEEADSNKAAAVDGEDVGVVVGIITGVLVVVALVVFILAVLIKRKRQRDIEFERAAKVQRSSANTAGVYVDLATDTPIVKKPVAHTECSEMETLRKDEDEDEVA